MDPRLLAIYETELRYLREGAREFGEEYHAVAGSLGLDNPEVPDPYVERLLEGVAFLGARVQLKLKDQFPEFTQHLLQSIQPHFLAPTPSICIAAFEPGPDDSIPLKGLKIDRYTELSADAGADSDVPVIFRTGHDVTLWPLKIEEAEYLASPGAVEPFMKGAGKGIVAEAGLRLRISATGGAELRKILPSRLALYLAGSDLVSGELYRHLIGDTLEVIARDPQSAGDETSWTHLPLPTQIGFADDEALLPPELRAFRGYRLLAEYFACPERFMFVNIEECGQALAKCQNACDIVFLFKRASEALAGAVRVSHFRLNATPAINLFEKQVGRFELKPHEHEYHLVPDRNRPLDFEVVRLLEVKAFEENNKNPQSVTPLYTSGGQLDDWRNALYYTVQLRPRKLSAKERKLRPATDYIGTESWISLTAPGRPERLDPIREVGVRALVTNRELPELLTFAGEQHFTMAGETVGKVSMLLRPTRPRTPLGLSDQAWQLWPLIGHLTANYASLAPEDRDDPRLLKDHLSLYARKDDIASSRQIRGVTGVRSHKISRRLPGLDRLAVARGQRISVKLDDSAFDRSRMFLFGAVLERFLAEFATVNSFTETHFSSPAEGEFMRWPPRTGRRHNI